MKRVALICGVLALWGLRAPAATESKAGSEASGARVNQTLHNLSATGPGTTRALDEDQVCVFCHVPHGSKGDAPMWNRSLDSAQTLLNMERTDGQGLQSSALCLSCHDGILAIGELEDRTVPVTFRGKTRLDPLPQNRVLLGPGAHPVGVRARSDKKGSTVRTFVPAEPKPSIVDSQERVQCNSCHDPHNDSNYLADRVPHFWRDSTVEQTCQRCHDAPLRDRPHALEELSAGCASCHLGHGVEDTPMLPARASQACLECHGADGSAQGELVRQGRLSLTARPSDVERQFRLPQVHPLSDAFGQGAGLSREQVSCSSCHPAHGVENSDTARGFKGLLRPELQRGAWANCYDCHGDDQTGVRGRNIEARFSSSAGSSHPLGRSPRTRVPGLLAEGNHAMGCGDCHGSSEKDAKEGLHGSRWQGLLKLPYFRQDVERAFKTTELCFSCHDATVLDDETQGWEGHRLHVTIANESCGSCHDPHGSPDNQGLVDFGDGWGGERVMAGQDGRLIYRPDGDMGSCSVNCHGVEHSVQSQTPYNSTPSGVRGLR